MRSPREITFRLRQEAWNVWRLAKPPTFVGEIAEPPLAHLPEPTQVAAKLRGSVFANQVIGLAEKIRQHRFPVLGFEIDTGPHIDWRRDYIHGRTSGTEYAHGASR